MPAAVYFNATFVESVFFFLPQLDKMRANIYIQRIQNVFGSRWGTECVRTCV